jgi:2-polyprenyl-6-methoxyphenol hydroxylase-like FAD-dependent oxidoreductase
MSESIQTRCCIAGGGPAGMMLGFLLARAGIDVVVLEKHADFLRDFRGDTIHPSTLELMYELGLLDEFLRRPHQEVRELGGKVAGQSIILADFRDLPTHCKFLAFVPQWDFLNFIAEQASRYPTFHLIREAEVIELIQKGADVKGARAKTPRDTLEVRASLTVGADGRHSAVRRLAKFEMINIGAPMDVLWMRLSRQPRDPGETFGFFGTGAILVMLNRGDYWQCAFVIRKGAGEEIEKSGISALREKIVALAPFVQDRVQELRDWKDVSLLTVSIDRLLQWSRPGLLCIGDAAHAMSPIGGVGINLAIQDAVAAANILADPLSRGTPGPEVLRSVQERRSFPTRATQSMQVFIQNNVIERVLDASKPVTLAWPFKLIQKWPYLRRIPARFIGVGFRPEHVKTRDVGRTNILQQ